MFKHLKNDIPSGIVVFLVALPLCLAIGQASGASYFSGIISGIVGGIVVGMISGSSLSVSGPAAGLVSIVLVAIQTLPSFEVFLVAVVLAGVMQLLFGILKAGKIAYYIPNSVITGMLAAIGILLILKQIPHALGYDMNFEGDEDFIQSDGHNTITEIYYSFIYANTGAVIIFLIGIGILLTFEIKKIKKSLFAKMIPGALIAVISAILVNSLFVNNYKDLALAGNHIVDLPQFQNANDVVAQFRFPDFVNALQLPAVWIAAITIALVASIESLLSLEAVDRIDPDQQISPPNRELFAQGTGNIVSGFLGGIPITSVIVRSSANITAGAKTKMSTIIHGTLLMVFVIFFPALLNKIPKAVLASILILIGYKLANPKILVNYIKKGKEVLIPFLVTVFGILFSNLLLGVILGIAVGIYFVLKTNYHKAASLTQTENYYLLKFHKDVSFLNKPLVRELLSQVKDGSMLTIDGTNASFIDNDILDEIENFCNNAESNNITITKKNFEK